MQKLTNIQPFIDLGLHTVPILGKQIIRNLQGKKQGYSFPSNWQAQFSQFLNESPSKLGGLLTGAGDNIVAIDCDDTQTYTLFRDLDPTNTAVFESIGKTDHHNQPIKACTILYHSIPDLPPSKRLKGDMDLDWYNGTGMVFLPTEANTTKETWWIKDNSILNHDGDLVTIKPMPPLVAQVLELVLSKDVMATTKTVATVTHSRRSKGYLGKVLTNYNFSDLIADKEYVPELTKLLTPKEYRTALYHKQGHIHPKDVGVRHDYLFKIMCQLAGDNTVDQDLAHDTIMYINSLLDPPRSQKQMESEIISGIISGRQTNQQGQPYWEYDENWETLRSWTAITKGIDADLVDIFYDHFRKDYLVYNTQTDHLTVFSKKAQLIEHIQASTIGAFNQKEVIADMNNVETLVNPKEDFGYIHNDQQFNLFKPTEALRILADPTRHEADYKPPLEFINYMEHFIPDEQQRTYFLSLIRTKLTTFNYSPVVPYIIGIPGSGKGVLMTILAKFMGEEYVSKEVSGGLFISPFNKGWLENKYFVNLNELAEGLQTKAERTKGIGDLKLYTGSEQFQCHGKGRDPYSAPQKAMFIMTANNNPLAVEDNDRRIYYISTPNTFDSSPQCKASNSSRDIYYAITTQIEDIAYWLATEVKNLDDNHYTTAPHHAGRNTIIFSSLPIAEKIVWALAKKEFKLVEDYLYEPSVLFENANEDKVYLDNLVEAYNQVGNMEEIDKVMKGLMKKYELKQYHSNNRVYWVIDGMANHGDYSKKMPVDEDAEDIKLEEKMRI